MTKIPASSSHDQINDIFNIYAEVQLGWKIKSTVSSKALKTETLQPYPWATTRINLLRLITSE